MTTSAGKSWISFGATGRPPARISISRSTSEELARNHPELSSYRYLAIGDQVVLVDPQQQKIVQVID